MRKHPGKHWRSPAAHCRPGGTLSRLPYDSGRAAAAASGLSGRWGTRGAVWRAVAMPSSIRGLAAYVDIGPRTMQSPPQDSTTGSDWRTAMRWQPEWPAGGGLGRACEADKETRPPARPGRKDEARAHEREREPTEIGRRNTTKRESENEADQHNNRKRRERQTTRTTRTRTQASTSHCAQPPCDLRAVSSQ